MSVAHVLRPAPEDGARQLFLLFPDAGQSWQSMRLVGDVLAEVFPAAAIVALQGPHAVAEGGCWLMRAEPGSVDGDEPDKPEGQAEGASPHAGIGGLGVGVDVVELHPAGPASGGDLDRRTVPLALATADEPALTEAVATALPGLIGSIRVWQAQMKVLPEATALIGVGEGATMALVASLARPDDGHPVCGRVSVLGGRYVVPAGEVLPTLLLHLLHGKADPLVHYQHTVKAAEALVKQGGDVVADIVPHETGPVSEELVGWLMNRLMNRVPRHIWQAAMRTTNDEASNRCPSEGGN
ncbi:MAG: hypothetical protein Q4D19_04495 [Lautropia sp.]|nr:hypothetical protein [Lautropia sp.]